MHKTSLANFIFFHTCLADNEFFIAVLITFRRQNTRGFLRKMFSLCLFDSQKFNFSSSHTRHVTALHEYSTMTKAARRKFCSFTLLFRVYLLQRGVEFRENVQSALIICFCMLGERSFALFSAL